VSADDGNAGVNAEWGAMDVRDDMEARLRAAALPDHLVTLARSCERCFELGAHLHNPLVPWSGLDGRAVLIGDAAHAMPPFLGQGTNQAVQDAYCLAQELARVQRNQADLPEALAAYEGKRKFATARLAVNSRVLGFVETGLPAVARDNFFRATAFTGVAKTVFLDGAIPKV